MTGPAGLSDEGVPWPDETSWMADSDEPSLSLPARHGPRSRPGGDGVRPSESRPEWVALVVAVLAVQALAFLVLGCCFTALFLNAITPRCLFGSCGPPPPGYQEPPHSGWYPVLGLACLGLAITLFVCSLRSGQRRDETRLTMLSIEVLVPLLLTGSEICLLVSGASVTWVAHVAGALALAGSVVLFRLLPRSEARAWFNR